MTEAVTRCARLVDQLQISPRGTASAPQHFGLVRESAPVQALQVERTAGK